ncbi:uncharacterized protein B0I36DRAFT_249958, partial [Microdochium trichocladiopsis]
MVEDLGRAHLQTPLAGQWHPPLLAVDSPARSGSVDSRPRSAHSRRRLRRDDYTVGWVSALPLELRAALACLDEQHDTLPRDRDDYNAYVFGRIHQHNVVMASLPSGDYGNNSAANVAVHMRRSFPSIQLLLLIGIAGGVPSPADVRLGDIVVGLRVVQHDLGREVKNGQFVHTAAAAYNVHSSIGTTLALMQASVEPGAIGAILDNMRAARPSLVPLIARQRREHTDEPVIHYGTIASGDQVVKHAGLRDHIGQTHGALCIEMEAAGLKHDFPSLTVRGVCDYADSHKKKEWQPYAAATAAAFAKLFLSHSAPPAQPSPGDDVVVEEPEPSVLLLRKFNRKKWLESLFFEQIDARLDGVSDPHDDTCAWILETDAYLGWQDPKQQLAHHGFLWVRGKAGVGKSTIMKFLCSTARKESLDRNEIVLSFFFHARGGDLEKSTIGMFRSILYQLFTKAPHLQTLLDDDLPEHIHHTGWSLGKLQKLTTDAVAQLGGQGLTMFIDALDECNETEGSAMVRYFQRLARSSFASAVRLRVCFSSRPFPVVDVRKGLFLVLEDEEGHMEDLESYVYAELEEWPEDSREGVCQHVIDKAKGVFLWAVLVTTSLLQDKRRGRLSPRALVNRFTNLPLQLSDLFKDILRRDEGDIEELRLCVQWLLYAKETLSPEEYYQAITTGLAIESGEDLEPWDRDSMTPDVLQHFITSTSRGLAEAKGRYRLFEVEFVHETVRDFFVNGDGLQELFGDIPHDSASCHNRLKKICRKFYLSSPMVRARETPPATPTDEDGKESPFLRYAAEHLLDHAESCATQFPDVEFLSTMDCAKW